MPEYRVVEERARSFFPVFERKADTPTNTHYCPGCGHGILHKLVARAIDQLGIQDRTIFISPVGCSVFAYYYFDTGHIQAAHGRAPAVATAVKRSRPDSIVIGYQGDGDLAAIGTAEIIHAANRGEPITVIFVNNAIYGMTGGQLAPTTLVGQRSSTSPLGRNPALEGYPLHVCELLNTLEAPAYIARVALGNSKQIQTASKAVKKAIANQVEGRGFSFVEVLSPCPTVWGKNPVEAQHWVRDEMTKAFPCGVLRDTVRTSQAEIRATGPSVASRQSKTSPGPAGPTDHRLKIAGFGGQGALLLGELLAQAGLASGLEVSWLPSYGPEMRSGTSHCHVRLSDRRIDSPLVSHPNILIALNEPSLRKFVNTVERGGWIFYNGTDVPGECERRDVNWLVQPFTAIADELGEPRTMNMIVLGAMLQTLNVLPHDRIDGALEHLVKNPRWLDLDRRAIESGRKAVQGVNHASRQCLT
jgi:2-oxoisovalerate ferredoxin oxidoreductase beta subunit